MSFQEEKRESIKRYMLAKIEEDDVAFVQKTAENFQISQTTVKRYIRDCMQAEVLVPSTEQFCGYALTEIVYEQEYHTADGLLEDRIYFQDIQPYLETLSENSRRIWGYVFTEILNNAIEHAQAGHIFIRLRKTVLDTEITITDDGIGLFRNIQMYMRDVCGKQASYEDVIAELYKGRMTTDPEEHTGEGIFFSSKIMEQFMIRSDGAMFRTGYREADRLLESHLLACHARMQRLGTMVYMRLENSCDRSLQEVFDMFAPEDEGFVKTILPIREVCPYGEPIARSQARRLLYRLENFREVVFDFTGVDFMGQGFADEIFRIFQRKHPDIVLRAVGANDSVQRMIQHVCKTGAGEKKQLT